MTTRTNHTTQNRTWSTRASTLSTPHRLRCRTRPSLPRPSNPSSRPARRMDAMRAVMATAWRCWWRRRGVRVFVLCCLSLQRRMRTTHVRLRVFVLDFPTYAMPLAAMYECRFQRSSHLQKQLTTSTALESMGMDPSSPPEVSPPNPKTTTTGGGKRRPSAATAGGKHAAHKGSVGAGTGAVSGSGSRLPRGVTAV